MPEHLNITNSLLLTLNKSDQDLLLPHLETVRLTLRQLLAEEHRPLQYAYFLQSGLASIVARTPTTKAAEIGIVGREGVVGSELAIGDRQSPFEVFVQMEGTALRIGAAELETAIGQSESLRLLLGRYSRSLWIQAAYTAITNAQSRIEARLARWLLMVHDRADGDAFHITHEFMALMLAVRRPGVTVALHELEGKGLIRSLRREVVIRDREGLIEMADGGYTLPEIEYERLIGAPLMRRSGRVKSPDLEREP
ncbi:MAG: cyclic nucleotide-binding protein [Devosia sp.]|uniref:Crp/Fnr family transcriptional regulator n=1 Tax=Devosia sp. TaxID=1871048 RepID=UPI00262E48F2|nr:Crp/Fnr family transcriptional regulator [Devosia sp.]MDB5529133.1 cyclic nucleotide-binding protein [Devosia sp.]